MALRRFPLSRNLGDLDRLAADLTSRHVTIRLHDEGLTFGNDDSPTNKLKPQLLGAIAEFERRLINERRREGMAQAKQKGKRIGPQRKLTPKQIEAIRRRIAQLEEKRPWPGSMGCAGRPCIPA